MKKLFLLLILFFFCGCSTLETNIVKSANLVNESVVRIETRYIDIDSNGSKIEAYSIGSGVIYKTFGINSFGTRELKNNRKYQKYEYYLLTNRHVISQGETFKVYLGKFDEYVDAKVLGYDDKLDIAIMSFEYTKYINSVKFSETGVIKQGSFVFTIGNPDGYLDSLTMGVVSYPTRALMSDTNSDKISDFVARYIQIDAAINPGSSGGGLFDSKGKLIGINTMKIVDEKIEGIGFAILLDDIKPLIPFLEKGIIPKRVELGIVASDVNSLTFLQVQSKLNY